MANLLVSSGGGRAAQMTLKTMNCAVGKHTLHLGEEDEKVVERLLSMPGSCRVRWPMPNAPWYLAACISSPRSRRPTGPDKIAFGF
jgi:hypothetical protein